MKAYCKKEKIDELLDRRPIKYIVEKMNENGYKMTLKNFYNLYNNKSNWLLVYSFGVAQVFGVKIEDLFYVE